MGQVVAKRDLPNDVPARQVDGVERTPGTRITGQTLVIFEVDIAAAQNVTNLGAGVIDNGFDEEVGAEAALGRSQFLSGTPAPGEALFGREALFGEPATEYEQLAKLVKDFEPDFESPESRSAF